MAQIYWLVLGILCAWRITHLLQAEDGPWNLIVRLRVFTGEGFAARLLDCFYCLSLWVAAPLALVLGETLTEQLLLWPAISAGAIGMQLTINDDGQNSGQELPAIYLEDEEI
jgi:hypothetical protein